MGVPTLSNRKASTWSTLPSPLPICRCSAASTSCANSATPCNDAPRTSSPTSRPTRHLQRPDGDDQRSPRTPPRLRTRLPQLHRLHRPHCSKPEGSDPRHTLVCNKPENLHSMLPAVCSKPTEILGHLDRTPVCSSGSRSLVHRRRTLGYV